MSRIIVKNLPNSTTEEKLKERFSQKGHITDLQLKFAEDGKFRHFAFIGYLSEQEAEAALNYFNNSYFGASKIQVEKCVNLGETKKRGKASVYPTEADKLPEKAKEKKTEEEISPEFQEFLEVHSKNQHKNAIWGNDGTDGTTAPKSKESEGESKDDAETSDQNKEAHKKELSDLEYLKSKVKATDSGEPAVSVEAPEKEPVKKQIAKKEFFTVKMRGFPCQSKKKDIRKFLEPLKPDSIRLPPKVKGVAYVGFASEKDWKNALNKNRSFHDGHRIFVTNYVKKEETESDKVSTKSKKNESWIQQEADLKKEETIAESGRIFIRNLSYSVNEEALEALFSPYGPVAEIHLPVDKYSRKIKGFAFVTFVMPEHAVRAYTELDGSIFQGRMLHLLAGKAKLSADELADVEGSGYKQKKLKEQKAQAGSSHNWNTLFLGTNAVATLMAERYGTTKQQVLLENDGRGSQSVAVRLALGETQLVAETKQFLVDNGIHLEAFSEAPKERSKTVILVKNLETQTTVSELRDLFTPFGEVGRVLLPPNGVTAIVEFLEPSEAKVAFRKLAYSKFHHIPLYLEWAPINTFRKSSNTKSNQETKDTEASKNGSDGFRVDPTPNTAADVPEGDEPEPDTTLFVKNLNFGTMDESLRQHFAECGPIFSATVAKKKDPKNPGQFLSMGYGFVQFWKKQSVTTALKDLQNSKLDDHVIELKRSNKTSDTKSDVLSALKKTVKNAKEPISSKILVRNVPFEAKTKEVAELFKPFGELKSVRLPKKSIGSGSHRGFAFIEFLTKQDAKRAFESLSDSTHLYGRRLVLEWAAEEETVEDVRRRTASHYVEGPPAKKSKALGVLGDLPDSD